MNPVLVELYRDRVLESYHRGVICIVNAQQEVVYAAGDIHQICYPRSAMKLLQVIPLLVHGGQEKFGLTLEEIAVMCGSHNAEPDHVNAVRSILQKIGLSESALQCGAQFPSSRKDANALIRNGEKPAAIHNNCSGKHAGMLAACVLLGLSTTDYIDPQHPLQQEIADVCSTLYNYPKSQMITALDGCSAPIYAVPVYHQAIGYMNLVSPSLRPDWRKACDTLLAAVSAHPFMVAGTGRYCTDMLRVTAPDIIGKTGAEGIFCMAFAKPQWGVCIKIDDGKMAPQYNIAQAVLEQTGLVDQALLSPLHHYLSADIQNFSGKVTGKTAVAQPILDGLKKI